MSNTINRVFDRRKGHVRQKIKCHVIQRQKIKKIIVHVIIPGTSFNNHVLSIHEFHETCHSVTFIVLVNSHQRWKQTRNRVCFHLWCELTLALWCHSIVWGLFFQAIKCNGMTSFMEFMFSLWRFMNFSMGSSCDRKRCLTQTHSHTCDRNYWNQVHTGAWRAQLIFIDIEMWNVKMPCALW